MSKPIKTEQTSIKLNAVEPMGGQGLDLPSVFRKMCTVRYFDLKLKEAYEKKRIPGAIYLSVGQESPSAVISEITPNYTIFTQHRCHAAFLAHGGNPVRLRDELLGLGTGPCEGRGGSPSIYDTKIPMFPYHGLIGEHLPLATGHALATGNPTLVYVGDAGAEEDYALAAYGFASTHKLPVLFVCENNGLSILTKIHERRSWKLTKVAKSFGLATAEAMDDPQEIYAQAKPLLNQLPAFINIKTCRHYWHAGVGVDGPPAWDRLAEFRSQVTDAATLEQAAKDFAAELWDPFLK